MQTLSMIVNVIAIAVDIVLIAVIVRRWHS